MGKAVGEGRLVSPGMNALGFGLEKLKTSQGVPQGGTVDPQLNKN